MPGGTIQPGPGRLQCPECKKWFRPAGLSGHRRFYHGQWKQQLQDEVTDLAMELRPKLSRMTFVAIMTEVDEMREPELLRWRRYLEAKRN